jgi:hypothetical protein
VLFTVKLVLAPCASLLLSVPAKPPLQLALSLALDDAWSLPEPE